MTSPTHYPPISFDPCFLAPVRSNPLGFENQMFVDELFCLIYPVGFSDLQTLSEIPFLGTRLHGLVESAQADAQVF